MILNKVTDAWLVNAAGERVEIQNDRLYRVVADLYSAQMLGAVTDMSYGLLALEPKWADGTPIDNLEDAIVMENGRELKAWDAIARYMASFADTDGNGTPLTGAALTIAAFETVFGKAGGDLLSLSVVLFAFSSILGWAYQGECAFSFLFGLRFRLVYRLVFAAAAFYGAVASLETVFALSDLCNALMCFPNLVCLLLLSGTVAKEARKT